MIFICTYFAQDNRLLLFSSSKQIKYRKICQGAYWRAYEGAYWA